MDERPLRNDGALIAAFARRSGAVSLAVVTEVG